MYLKSLIIPSSPLSFNDLPIYLDTPANWSSLNLLYGLLPPKAARTPTLKSFNQDDDLPLGFKNDNDENAIPLAAPHNGAVQSNSWSSYTLTPSKIVSIIENIMISLAACPINLPNLSSPYRAIAKDCKS